MQLVNVSIWQLTDQELDEVAAQCQLFQPFPLRHYDSSPTTARLTPGS